jgi:hypothetical protein
MIEQMFYTNCCNQKAVGVLYMFSHYARSLETALGEVYVLCFCSIQDKKCLLFMFAPSFYQELTPESICSALLALLYSNSQFLN